MVWEWLGFVGALIFGVHSCFLCKTVGARLMVATHRVLGGHFLRVLVFDVV